MEKLIEKASNYAEENVNTVLKEAFAKVYSDGYRDGYKDCKEDISVDLQNGETEYIDLGLPSGTMWSSDYKQNDNDRDYLPYGRAELLNIPTQEQWEELKDNCKWEFEIDDAYDLCKAQCVGPNGNTLLFERTGRQDFDKKSNSWEVFFWVKDDKEGNNKSAVHIYNAAKGGNKKVGATVVEDFFIGYKLPVRLVKTK